MKIKRAVMMAVLVAAVAALALPVIGLRARAASNSADFKAKARLASLPQQQQAADSQPLEQSASPAGKYSPDTLKALGIKRLPDGVHSRQVGKLNAARIARANPGATAQVALPPGTGPGGAVAIAALESRKGGGSGPPLAGQPNVLNELGALSAALITTIGGRDTQFSEVALLADWDGREDCVADRSTKVDDFSTIEPDIDFTLTKAAVSEVTFANGHLLNLYYYGDSVGNTYFGADLVNDSLVDVVFDVNLPDLVTLGTSNGFVLQNPTIPDCADDQMTVTGIAVNPVADLGDFGPAFCGIIGEVIYVSAHDSQGCASNASNQPIRTRIFAFATFNIGGTVFIVPQVRQLLRNSLGNVAGVAVDDDGSLYFHLADLVQLSGGAIFKATEQPRAVCESVSRINRVIPLIPNGLVPTQTATFGLTTNTPITSGGVRLTNYTSAPVGSPATTALTPEFGNITAITTGPCNVLYAAVAASFVAGDVSFVQLTQGLFTNRSALGATPSMIISFADCSGAFDLCSGEATGGVTTNVGGNIPIADGFADGPSANPATPRQAGINNFRVFVIGNGPDIRPGAGQTSAIITPGTQRIEGFQVDFTLHSGIAVNEEGTVFVISGGTPAGIGKNPSPMFTEILCFEDMCPMDRRADFTDLRGSQVPNPPASGGNIGDGLDTRFDHIFHQAPIDQVTLTPTGLSGLARGFLRYTNRLAPVAMGPGVLLGSSAVGGQPVQDDDDSDGPIIFEFLDPSHQTAGGDDSNVPNRGDDDDGLGTPPLLGFRDGGFEFLFGGPVGTAGCVWNGFFLNSNGNITFGAGDTDNTPTVPELRSDEPRIAPAWADLNPDARAVNLATFPVQALGFANINAFRVRWINVPEFGLEFCRSSNTFSVTLYDDGTGIDENSNKALEAGDVTGDNLDPAFDLQEGPTDLRFVREPNTGVLVGCPPRPEGSGHFIFEYCRMDLLGTADRPVIVGFSIGGTSPLNPPGLCEINLSTAAAAADLAPFGVIQGVTASLMPCLIGEGTEPHLFELFNEGLDAGIGSGGEITFATPDFDLRFEGNDAALCTPSRQRDLNRGKVGFFGVGCAPPANPLCQTVVVGSFVTAPNQTTPVTDATSLIDALCGVTVNLVGCGFFPNETTIICQGFQSDTGVPLQRPGKTVSTAVSLACDTNGDGIVDATIALGSVTPVNKNLVRATFNPLAAFPGTAFPTACCGGAATLTVTTTFTAGDNNIFGPFTRTVVCAINLGVRAPVVFSVTPSDGNCAVPIQNLIVTGACFCLPNGAAGVTSVFAVEVGNPSNVLQAVGIKVLSCFLLDAEFRFTSANAGRTFLIFVVGPGGTSRNLTSLPVGAPPGCPLGNEQGIQVTFTCNATSTQPCVPGTPGCPPCVQGDPRPECQTIDIAVIRNCDLNRSDAGVFTLTVTGENIKEDAAVTVNGVSPKKVKFRDRTGTDTTGRDVFARLVLKGRLCANLPGTLIVINPGARASVPFVCNETCPSN